MISKKNDFNDSDRLIVALDLPDIDYAKKLVTELGSSVNFYKVGLELAMTGEYFNLISWLNKKNKKVFADLKFYDIPNTVSSAIRQLNKWDIEFITVHGDRSIMQAAADSRKNNIKLLAVTVLTSINKADLSENGITYDTKELVLTRAKLALQSGIDGIISSGQETKSIRKKLGNDLIIVNPGIRLLNNKSEDDQKRIVTPSEAIKNGADFIVIGRPIRNAKNPKKVADEIQLDIANCL
ncbi:MAG: orotidine-5'-phosphate decarboxylase [Gammaproteobacteria bacterium TMED78]|nr:MAG: orotidine-5'-phosphate decarboxylase [Gammaproteobacteria bacterium TMED78]|tara:strand:- start:131301 stop:132017 length:717 start_codon:yes stop_codon:yes gene_type:complete